MENKNVDDLIAMIDGFMAAGGGHMNVRVEEDGGVHTDTASVKITTMNSLDCAGGNMACKVPTLFEGMDREED